MFEDNGNKCGKCQNHEYEVLKKGHARECPFKKCDCRRCRLLDARSDILQVISGKETKLKGTKKDPHCGFCQNHGIKILRKGHVRSCGFGQESHFLLDNCFDCEVHYIRNEVNRLQIKMRRAMKEDRTLSEEQRKTAREAITRDEVEKVCEMARLARKKRETVLTAHQVAASLENGESSAAAGAAGALVHSSGPKAAASFSPGPYATSAPSNAASSASSTLRHHHQSGSLTSDSDLDEQQQQQQQQQQHLSTLVNNLRGRPCGGGQNAAAAGALGGIWRPWSLQQQQQQQQQIVAAIAAQQQQQQHGLPFGVGSAPQRITNSAPFDSCDSPLAGLGGEPPALNHYWNHRQRPPATQVAPLRTLEQRGAEMAQLIGQQQQQQQQQPLDMQMRNTNLNLSQQHQPGGGQQFVALVNSSASMLQSNYFMSPLQPLHLVQQQQQQQQQPPMQPLGEANLGLVQAKVECELATASQDSDSSRNSSAFSEASIAPGAQLADGPASQQHLPPTSGGADGTHSSEQSPNHLQFFNIQTLNSAATQMARPAQNGPLVSQPQAAQVQRTPQEQQQLLGIIFRVLFDNIRQQQQQQFNNRL